MSGTLIETAVILAIGSNTHQSELIYNRPRTMLPAVGKPLVVRVMDRLYRIGITDFIVILGEQEGNIASFLSSKWVPNVNIEYVLKLNTQPLAKIIHQIAVKHEKPFLLTGYNSFTHPNFPKRLRKFSMLSPRDLIICGAPQSLSVTANYFYGHTVRPNLSKSNSDARTVAEIANNINSKPNPNHQSQILTTFTACGSNFVRYLTDMPPEDLHLNQFMDIVLAYQRTKAAIRIAHTSWVLQVEADADLVTLNRNLLDEQIDAHILSEIPYTVRIREPVRIDPGVSIGQGAVIGPHVYLERGCSVGHKVQIKNAIVLERSTVPAKTEIENAIISTRGQLELS